MDKEVMTDAESLMWHSLTGMDEICSEGMMKDGGILLCRTGSAILLVNYEPVNVAGGSAMTLFPGDMISVGSSHDSFSFDALTFSPSILREASLDMEQTVYSSLREDRCRGGDKIVEDIVSNMFSLLDLYFSQKGCLCLKQLVVCQLKAFFIGFHDYLLRFPSDAAPVEGSKRKRALFDSFMKMQEEDFHKSRDVSYYADRLNITPKYLNTISKSITGHNAKSIIDHYVILKLKQELSNSDCPIKQLAWNYNFSDVSFFTRYFRLHTGTTPTAYRKSLIVSKI